MERTLIDLGVTNPRLLARGADIDRASQRLLLDAADELPVRPEVPLRDHGRQPEGRSTYPHPPADYGAERAMALRASVAATESAVMARWIEVDLDVIPVR